MDPRVNRAPNARKEGPCHNSVYLISSPYLYLMLVTGLCIPFTWPIYWLLSGAPVLEAVLLAGAMGMRVDDGDDDSDGEKNKQEKSKGGTQKLSVRSGERTRILPSFPLWPLATTLDLIYCICSTSWIFYYLFAVACWGFIPIVCLFQFTIAGNMLRKRLRKMLLLKTFGLQFIDDRIGIFDIPGLVIDTEVDGLMVIRGVTVRLSEMSLRFHGVEVGLKLMMGEGEEQKEIEVGIACEEVLVKLGRAIEVGDCFASVKGGEGEVSFKGAEGGTGSEKESGKKGNELFRVDSKMVMKVEGNEFEHENGKIQNSHGKSEVNKSQTITVQDEMTNYKAPKDTNVKEGIETIKTIIPDDTEAADKQYKRTLQRIHDTNSIQICRQEVQHLIASSKGKNETSTDAPETVNEDSDNDIRAAICSQLHRRPSITHPPSRSIKVTTIKSTAPPQTRSFLHRLPMLLRLFLNPMAHYHPVTISSLTATGSGKWIQEILAAKLLTNDISPAPTLTTASSPSFHARSFSDLSSRDEDENTIPQIHQRINAWLHSANFVVELGPITGLARVPFFPSYSIHCSLSTTDVMAYRTLPSTTKLKQVVRLGGADATFDIPSFLLPHHDHLLPPKPSAEDIRGKGEEIKGAHGKVEELIKERERDLLKADECTVRIGAHARLPAVIDQELLDWVAGLVKASKVMEMEKETRSMDEELQVRGFKDFVGAVKGGRDIMGAVKGGMRVGMKKTLVNAAVNDKWIAKMVGKITKKLEEARGDVGYLADVKVHLGPYRLPEEERAKGEGDKILP
ncbi:hypothetical protein NHQ30_004556 [Ciborinia camelliae]|nr:hypothetical protein NHQ30_004556 [Ciborinia camelliae]